MNTKMTAKEKQLQIRKEVIVSLILYAAFFLWWYFTGYGLAEKGTPETYTYVLGLPMWFFLSCVVGSVLFIAATIIVVKLVFKNFDLDDESPDVAGSGRSASDVSKVVDAAAAEAEPLQASQSAPEKSEFDWNIDRK